MQTGMREKQTLHMAVFFPLQQPEFIAVDHRLRCLTHHYNPLLPTVVQRSLTCLLEKHRQNLLASLPGQGSVVPCSVDG